MNTDEEGGEEMARDCQCWICEHYHPHQPVYLKAKANVCVPCLKSEIRNFVSACFLQIKSKVI